MNWQCLPVKLFSEVFTQHNFLSYLQFIYCFHILFYTDISCLGGVIAKNTSRETKFSIKTGIFRKYLSQPSPLYGIVIANTTLLLLLC